MLAAAGDPRGPGGRWPSCTRSCAWPSSTRSRGPRAPSPIGVPPRCSPTREAGDERVAEHLLATEPRGDPWTTERLVGGAAAASVRRARVGGHIPPSRRGRAAFPEARSGVLLDLGVAEVTSGQADGEAHLREALDRARPTARYGWAPRSSWLMPSAAGSTSLRRSRSSTGGGCSRMPTRGLACCSRRWRSARACSTRHGARARAAPAGGAPAADEPTAPREALAVAALVAVHANEPATTCIALARRSLAAGPRIVPDPTDLPWFAQATIALVWADAHAEAQVPSMRAWRKAEDGRPRLFGAARPARLAAACGRAICRAPRETPARCSTPRARRPPLYRKLAAAILVEALAERGELGRPRRSWTRLASGSLAATHTSATLRLARGRLLARAGRAAEALADMLAAGDVALSTGSTCPGSFRGARPPRWPTSRSVTARRRSAWPAEELALAARSARRERSVSRCAPRRVAGGQAVKRSCASPSRCSGGRGRARARAGAGRARRAAAPRQPPCGCARVLREALERPSRGRRSVGRPGRPSSAPPAPGRGARCSPGGVAHRQRAARRELAADGLTNREIAQALFVTMRTVEGHLTRRSQARRASAPSYRPRSTSAREPVQPARPRSSGATMSPASPTSAMAASSGARRTTHAAWNRHRSRRQ